MMRSLLLALLAAVTPALLTAQRTVSIAPNARMVAWIPASMLQGTTLPWRDSVREAWLAHLTRTDTPLSPAPTPGSLAELRLQILRDGTLHRVRLVRSSGHEGLDAMYLAAAREAGRAHHFPPMPFAEEGAGVEVLLRAYLPIPPSARRPATRAAEERIPVSLPDGYLLPPLAAGCEEKVSEPNTWTSALLIATVDSATGDTTALGWARRTISALPGAFTSGIRAIPARPPEVFTNEELGRQDLLGVLRLRIDPTGRLISAELIGSTGYRAIDSELVAMATRADSLRLIPAPTQRDTADLELRFSFGPRASGAAVALGAVVIGEWELETIPRPTHFGRIEYPRQLRSQGIGGRVSVAFIIGADGRPVPGSLIIRSSPHPDFSTVTRTMILGMRFEPATIRACAVPSWAQQSVNYRP